MILAAVEGAALQAHQSLGSQHNFQRASNSREREKTILDAIMSLREENTQEEDLPAYSVQAFF